MWIYIVGVILLVLAVYLIFQGIRCNIAVKESKDRLATYEAKTAMLSYGKMRYVDKGEGEVILSVHGIFGGYDQAYECFILGKHTARNGVAGISPPRREFQKC